jgi:hypothetical protein
MHACMHACMYVPFLLILSLNTYTMYVVCMYACMYVRMYHVCVYVPFLLLLFLNIYTPLYNRVQPASIYVGVCT